MHSIVRPGAQIVLRLPSGLLKPVEIQPNTTISIGKFGSFPSNLLLGRPYHFTYEILESQDGKKSSSLRIVPAAELHAEALSERIEVPTESRDEQAEPDDGNQFDIVGEDGQVIMRNNRLTVDDPSRQALSMEEIEELKKAASGSGKEIISKIMAAHSALNEKTSFSLAKYTLRKAKKYMKRFTVLPMDVGLLSQLWLDKDVSRIMEMREETLGLLLSWANVHHNEDPNASLEATERENTDTQPAAPPVEKEPSAGRYLVVDDTCGLVVAATADRMGILYPQSEEESEVDEDENIYINGDNNSSKAMDLDAQPPTANGTVEAARTDSNPAASKPMEEDSITKSLPPDASMPDASASTAAKPTPSSRVKTPAKPGKRAPKDMPQQSSATSNTITVLHANTQPNLSHLKYFGFTSEEPSPDHPLFTRLKSLTWLQLLDPAADSLYTEPPELSPAQLQALKSGKRGAYFRKRRRWEKTKAIVDATREGGFDALIIASTMDLKAIMKHCVPLVRGGGQIVVYSPSPEPLTVLMDMYSRDRKGAYVRLLQAGNVEALEDEEDFPINPTLVLNPMMQTSRAREWQVLPMRTHPMMTSRGGSEGYIFSATRVLPAEGVKIEARGKFGKKRKAEGKAEAELVEKKARTDETVGEEMKIVEEKGVKATGIEGDEKS
ncbi:putative eukaryotic translation initiation factor gamma protein [Venturia nashicola]|uniref:tRNA (adenine(58)-N(1))-methyltransferase non-catalytic subunit TRM6 n=1 Tax=Venturia nashicola TaxID=86259 RepID=A0A4Z1P6T3_9PEZI|nr:putative eukaryotic translation initiation factor gamma protein [Venturia nashicola]TLD23655.1 putative eukaryotic translation initiation factor gamma protein [Venturia nashicola]